MDGGEEPANIVHKQPTVVVLHFGALPKKFSGDYVAVHDYSLQELGYVLQLTGLIGLHAT